MQILEFLYQNDRGERKGYALRKWEEVGHYIHGICQSANAFRTFRKDRVVEYLAGRDELRDPHPVGPPPIPTRTTSAAPRVQRHSSPQICFTGFSSALRSDLERQAADAGLHVCKSVVKDLHFLCVGPNAGPTKVRKSREQGTYIVGHDQFKTLIETGELPDSHEVAQQVDEQTAMLPQC